MLAGVISVPAAARAASSLGGSISRDEILARAGFGAAHPPSGGYDQSRSTFYDPDGRAYRNDCSGYVSLCWHLASSATTVSLKYADLSRQIQKSELQPGDAMITTTTNANGGHVALFERWTDSSRSAYVGYEFGSGSGPAHHTIPYPYFPNDGRVFTPFRYVDVVDAAPGTPPEENAPTIAVTSRGWQYVFWKGTDGNLWQVQSTGGGWTGPYSLGGAPLGSAPSAGVDGAGNTYVVWKGADGHLWGKYFTGSAWSGVFTVPAAGQLG